jgi:hypothetical protein
MEAEDVEEAEQSVKDDPVSEDTTEGTNVPKNIFRQRALTSSESNIA